MSPLLAHSGYSILRRTCPLSGVKRTWRLHCEMSAFDAVDGASSAASKWYRLIASKPERFKEVRPGNEMAFEVFKELARTRRRNADTVDPGIGRTRLGQRTLKCVFLIGTRSAHSIRASGLTAAQTGRTHDRTRPMLQQRQKVLAKAPSTHDPKRTLLDSHAMVPLVTAAPTDAASSRLPGGIHASSNCGSQRGCAAALSARAFGLLAPTLLFFLPMSL